MSVDEASRRQLHETLVRRLGADSADTLMELLPLASYSELATREDVHATAVLLRGEMAELRTELRGEMAELRTELRGEMAVLRGDVTDRIGQLSLDLAKLVNRSTLALMAMMIALVVTVVVS